MVRQHPPQQEDPYSMQAIATQLGLIQQSQQNFQNRYEADQRMMGNQFHRIDSQLDWLMYHQNRYQPYFDHWAHRESDSMGQPLPAYAPPDNFMPIHRQRGFYLFGFPIQPPILELYSIRNVPKFNKKKTMC